MWGKLSEFAKKENAVAATKIAAHVPVIDLIHKELIEGDTEFYYEEIQVAGKTIKCRTIDSNITVLKICAAAAAVAAAEAATTSLEIRSYTIHDHFLFTTEDNHCGSEDLTLWANNLHTGARHILEKHVGPSVAASATHLYYTSAKKHLIYKHVIALEFATGVKRTVYTEHDERFNVSVEAAADGTIIANCENTRLTCESIQLETGKSTGRHTSTNSWWITSTVVLTNRGFPYYALCDESGPLWQGSAERGTIHCVAVAPGGWLIHTVKAAQSYIYYVTDTAQATTQLILGPRYATIQLMSGGCFLYKSPTTPDTVCRFTDGKVTIIRQDVLPEPTTLTAHYAISSDKTHVPYIIVTAIDAVAPTNLIVVGYGAYGIMLNLSYPKRWMPLLRRGYAVVYAFVRGGFEGGEAWYRGGALRNRGHCRQDFAACITSAQRNLGISSSQTTLYGRSAGGFLVASTANRFPQIAGRLYMEAPYLDVLRTTSNPELPLTELEHDEFGNPRGRESDKRVLAGLSPVDNVTHGSLFPKHVIIRAATHDSQVFYNESDRWVQRVHKMHPATSVFYKVDECQGHFVEHNKQLRNVAEDTMLILAGQ